MIVDDYEIRCICYGRSVFEPKKFTPMRAGQRWIKPIGGLWSSPVAGGYSWADWCRDETFNVDALALNFAFTFRGRALVIDGPEDVALMPHSYLTDDLYVLEIHWDDPFFSAIDGIHLTANGERTTRFHQKYSLYGWDCETVLVFNQGAIKCLTTKSPTAAHAARRSCG